MSRRGGSLRVKLLTGRYLGLQRELLRYAISMSLKYGFKVLLVDPRGTTSSVEHDKLMREHGLDGHAASAYLVALRGLTHQIT